MNVASSRQFSRSASPTLNTPSFLTLPTPLSTRIQLSKSCIYSNRTFDKAECNSPVLAFDPRLSSFCFILATETRRHWQTEPEPSLRHLPSIGLTRASLTRYRRRLLSDLGAVMDERGSSSHTEALNVATVTHEKPTPQTKYMRDR